MKIEIDNFAELKLAAAKMKGLHAYLGVLRKAKKTYDEGLTLAKQHVQDNGGQLHELEDGVIKMILNNEEAFCFQPYSDIDLFYFEC